MPGRTLTVRELTRSARGTLHAQLYDALRDRIQRGEFAPGDRLPTESELVTLYGVSRMTVRRALDELRRDGLVERKPALGTFVRDQPLAARIAGVHSLTDEIVQLGMTPGSVLLGSAIEPAADEVADQLEIDPATPVLKLDRVRTADGRPFYVAESYVNTPAFPVLEAQDYADPGLSLLATYRRVLGMDVSRMTQSLSATAAAPFVADALGIEHGVPVLRFERTVYLADGRPVEFVRAHFRGETYKFFSELS